MGRLIEMAQEEVNLDKIVNEYKTLLLLKKSGEATELLVNQIKQKEHIYTTRDDLKSEMWIYKEGIYNPQGRTYIKEFVRDVLREVYTEHKANEIIAKIEADTYIEGKDFFNKTLIDEICIENGILNIITRKLEPYTPEKIFFNKHPLKYIPNIECKNIKKHLKEVLKDETDIPVIQELFGYLLLKDYRFEKTFMLVGTGRNGKSKTLELMKIFVGQESCSSVTLKELENQFSKVELFNKMVNLAGDISNETIKDSSWFKGLSGRDMMGADRKFLNKLYFTNYAKLIFSANELPKTYDISPAFWNRWIILEFPYIFKSKKEIDTLSETDRVNVKEMDEDIINKISNPLEMSGLLNFALDGLDRLLKQKDFSYSKSVLQVRDFWIRKSDSFMAFCVDFIETNSDHFIEKKELRKIYNDYCKEHKLRVQGDKAIKNTFDIHFGVIEDRKMLCNDHFYVWDGVQFKKGVEKICDNCGKNHGFSIINSNHEEVITQGCARILFDIGKKNSIEQYEKGHNPVLPLRNDFNLTTVFNGKPLIIEDLESFPEIKNDFNSFQAILLDRENHTIPMQKALDLGFSEKQLEQWKVEGLIFEIKNGVVKLI